MEETEKGVKERKNRVVLVKSMLMSVLSLISLSVMNYVIIYKSNSVTICLKQCYILNNWSLFIC